MTTPERAVWPCECYGHTSGCHHYRRTGQPHSRQCDAAAEVASEHTTRGLVWLCAYCQQALRQAGKVSHPLDTATSALLARYADR